MGKIKVLIVDDSAIVRQVLSMILSEDPEIEIMGVASDPYFAATKIQKEIPDVITLDIEMPRMDGLTFLKKIMSLHPIPVVIISSITTEGADLGLKAIELGAVDIMTKPNLSSKADIEESKIKIIDTVKAAARARIKGADNRFTQIQTPTAQPTTQPKPQISKIANTAIPISVQPKLSADAVMPYIKTHFVKKTEPIIVVGASTGGTEALREFLVKLPADSPGIVIVQHMPEHFTLSFANRLNQLCNIKVKEAANNDEVTKGSALIAPGNHHMLLRRVGERYFVELNDSPLVNRHRPAVDILFRSAAMYAGNNAIGIIMTGMGDDGARGLLEMKESGALTIAQDEKSSVVFGMPKEAIKLGAADYILPLNQMADFVINMKG